MRPFSLRIGPAWGGLPWHRLQASSRRPSTRTNSSSSGAAASSRGSYLDRVKGWQGPWKAGITSGGLSAMGDLLAQFLSWQSAKHDDSKQFTYDPTRTARMLGFGLFWYGPLQYYWYNFLDWTMPIKTTASFITKVAANQLILAPVVLSTVFAWNLSLTGNGAQLQSKLQNDLMPTMMNGWKFWVPAASLNFYAIPVQQQVLYMSACGILWTAYLSYASATEVAQRPAAPAAAPPAPAAAAASPKGRK